MRRARQKKPVQRDEQRQHPARGDRASEHDTGGAASHASEPKLPAPSADGHVEGQAALLHDGHLHGRQQQHLLARIGRQMGNTYLQRLVEQPAKDGPGSSRVQRQPDAGIVDPPHGDRDAGLPAGVPEAVEETPAPAPEAEIPAELMTSIDPTTLTDDELRRRYDLLQQTLLMLMRSSPDTQLLQEQATQIRRVLAERQVEARVREELEGFLGSFSAITVTVRWIESTGTQSVPRTEEVAVHPPYFMNERDRVGAHARTLERYDAALANRRAADRATRRLLREISQREGRGGMGIARAKVGKSHPEDIRRILQAALDRNLVQGGAGRDRPNAEDLRNWLVRYGVGVDCSGFVSQALNRVTERIQEGPLAAGEELNRGAGSLRGGARGFTAVGDVSQLQPGDTMYIPGHIRIVTSVRHDEAGGTVFTTAESRAGGQADVGPDRAEWRDHEGQLQMRRSPTDAWSASGERPTYGRYQRLQGAMEQAAEREAR
jgi:hypothetical protein